MLPVMRKLVVRLFVQMMAWILVSLDDRNERLFQAFFRVTVWFFGRAMPEHNSNRPMTHCCINSNRTLKTLFFRRTKRLYADLAERLHQPALILSVHASSEMSIALHLLLESPLAVVVRFPERVQPLWDFYGKATGVYPEKIIANKYTLETIASAVALGKVVSLYPDHGRFINPSCFKLVEAGVPVAFHYCTITSSGVPVLKYQPYMGPQHADACAQAFLDFLGNDCGLHYELA